MTSETLWKHTSGPFLRPLLAVLLLPLLTGCGTTGTAPIALQRVLPDEACLTLAEPLPPLLEPSLPAAIRNHVEVANMYWELAARHACLADFSRQ